MATQCARKGLKVSFRNSGCRLYLSCAFFFNLVLLATYTCVSKASGITVRYARVILNIGCVEYFWIAYLWAVMPINRIFKKSNWFNFQTMSGFGLLCNCENVKGYPGELFLFHIAGNEERLSMAGCCRWFSHLSSLSRKGFSSSSLCP